MKECDEDYSPEIISQIISIHALYERVRPLRHILMRSGSAISIHALYERVRLLDGVIVGTISGISIHALYERVRLLDGVIVGTISGISIHALYERVRQSMDSRLYDTPRFQSTHSMKECDGTVVVTPSLAKDFNPRTLWKSATYRDVVEGLAKTISIHALYERVRQHSNSSSAKMWEFQSTHSMKECDFCQRSCTVYCSRFQSTHSMKECDKYCKCPKQL